MLTRLVQQVKNGFESIKRSAEAFGGESSARGSADLFCSTITPDIDRIDLLLNGLLGYLALTTHNRKNGRVPGFIEEALKEKEAALREKQARLFKRFEGGLPDPAISDGEMKYILNSVLDYAVASLPVNGEIGLILKSIAPKEKETQSKIGILVFFSGVRRVGKALDLILRLVEEVVRRNKGIMWLEEDEEKGKTFVWLVLPVRNQSLF